MGHSAASIARGAVARVHTLRHLQREPGDVRMILS
jgi:hypothetical protein